jgi:hypothetical protein
VPNQLYGGGKLDLFAAAEDVLKPVTSVAIDPSGSLTWAAEPHSLTYDLYRGDLPGSLPGSYGICLAPALASPASIDPSIPAAGHGFFYLVTGVKDGIEGSLGFDSAGRQRPNASPCP